MRVRPAACVCVAAFASFGPPYLVLGELPLGKGVAAGGEAAVRQSVVQLDEVLDLGQRGGGGGGGGGRE